MLFIIASWFLWYFVVVGVGKFVRALFGFVSEINIFDAFWLGFTVLVALIGLLQLLYPLNNIVLCLVFLVGVTGYWLDRKQKPPKIRALYPLYLMIISIVITNISLSSVSLDGLFSFSTDTYGYHLSVVRWINEYATIPGLANLHTRLGYGTASSFFSFAALFDNWIWDGRSGYLCSSFLLAIALIQVIYEILYGTAKLKIYSFICFLYLLSEALIKAPGLYYDSVAFYFLIVAGSYVIKMIEANLSIDSITEGKYFNFYIAPSLITLSFTVKPMSIVILLCCAIIYALFFLRSPRIWTVAVVPVLLLSGYMLRNFVTSGWLLFPAPYINFSTAYSLSKETVENEYLIIKNWARAPGSNFIQVDSEPFYIWVSNWLRDNLTFNIRALFNIVTFFFPLLINLAVTSWYFTKQRRIYAIACMALFVSLVFWFFSAPDVRFARGFVWIWSALLLSALYDAGVLSKSFNFFLRHITESMMIFIVFECILLWGFALPYRNFEFSLWRVGKSESRQVKAVVLNNGQTPQLTVWVPARDGSLGDAPLPCTYYPNDRLCLFVPGDISKGFYLKSSDSD